MHTCQLSKLQNHHSETNELSRQEIKSYQAQGLKPEAKIYPMACISTSQSFAWQHNKGVITHHSRKFN